MKNQGYFETEKEEKKHGEDYSKLFLQRLNQEDFSSQTVQHSILLHQWLTLEKYLFISWFSSVQLFHSHIWQVPRHWHGLPRCPKLRPCRNGFTFQFSLQMSGTAFKTQFNEGKPTHILVWLPYLHIFVLSSAREAALEK